jgi:glycosyltransferase involved in cell wall biosynthesis
MKILVVSQYFWPETFIISDIVRKLVEQGHEVTVATGKPNYPDGAIYDGYRAGGTQCERYLDKVNVFRVPLWPRGSGGAKNLILNYVSFVLFGLICFPWLLRKQNFDAVFVYAPSPITQVVPAILLKWIKRAPLTVWVQDLWPESLAATGFLKNRTLLRVMGWMVRLIYCCCDRLLVQSSAFVDPVSAYASREKVCYYPNSIDASGAESAAVLPASLAATLEGAFCVVFAGNLGTAQALDTVLEAAILLREEPDIRFVLVGSGSRADWLLEEVKAHGLTNVSMPGRFPASLMPTLFERSGVLLVSLTDEPIFAQTIPSKIQAYLAGGKPIIAALNGEGARVALESGAGVAVPAEQPGQLAEAIREIRALSDAQRAALGSAGRAYFDAHFDMDVQVKRLACLLGGNNGLEGDCE